MNSSHLHTTGNSEILKRHKTAFLCSRICPAHIVLKAYDWATKQREKCNCIVSGFHSQIEKDVFHYLLKGEQPIILALARGLKKRTEPEIQKALEHNRLLIISPFDESVKRITAHASQDGNVEKLIHKCLADGKQISTFDMADNQHLIREGVAVYYFFN